jgi:NADH-quinone oxidoreductase subunit K
MIPLPHVIVLSALLFMLGVFGVLLRRNVLVLLMSVEVQLNAANLALIAFSRARQDVHGQALAFLVIAVAAAEAAVGLAIIVAVFRQKKTTDVDEITLLKH